MLAVFCTNIAAASENSGQDALVSEDPWESFNRPMFKLNHHLDTYLLKPAAKGYRAVTTREIRYGVDNVLANLKEPATAINYALQLDAPKAAASTGRFLVNSSLGLLGLFDVATGWGWTVDKTNFDRTLAKYCVPDGPYLVVPFLGSSSPRALAGKAVDSFADPIYWATLSIDDDAAGWYVSAAYTVFGAIAARESVLELSDDLERNSVDLYTTYRSVYLQNRAQYGCKKTGTESYDFDFAE
jgi:phospholipid-binding lipoprotein MlaA